MRRKLRGELRGLLDGGRVFFRGGAGLSPAEFEDFGRDRTDVPPGRHEAVVLPSGTEEVAAVVRFAREHGVPVVPSGGRTGLSGGAVASDGCLVLSLARMNRVLGHDPLVPSITVEAGVVTADLRREAERLGFFFPVDFASSGSSQIGGNIATNAGGIRFIRHGGMRGRVLGLTVVAGTGEILRFPGLLKNNTGPDLCGLFTGSEGVLGVVTEAVLKLAGPQPETEVVLLALDSLGAVTEVLAAARGARLPLQAFEFLDDVCMRAVREHLGLRSPFPREHPCLVLAEFDAAGALEGVAARARDAVVAGDPVRARGLWRLREAVGESLSALFRVHRSDVSVPVALAAECARRAKEAAARRGLEAACFGHAGDGNVHADLLGPRDMPGDEFQERAAEFAGTLLPAVREMGGSVSAEHGVGLLKRGFLGLTRGPEEIRMIRGIRRVFDPDGIMNPGKVVPTSPPP